MSEHKIGETVRANGKACEVCERVEGNTMACGYCVFYRWAPNSESVCTRPDDFEKCDEVRRQDNQSVFFREVRES